MPPRSQIVDACVLINLVASGEVEGILSIAGRRSFVCSKVVGEIIYLRTEDPSAPPEPIDLRSLIESGMLRVCHIEGTNEAERYVNYASVLDDGEAMSIAIALSRGFDLVTDDRKARRLFAEAEADPRRLISTSILIRMWAEAETMASNKLKNALLNIERFARYQPSAGDANYEWWLDSCA